MLKIVFQNLLLNSAHAMQGQGKIDVAIAAIDGVCEIAFADSGPGIPEEIRDKIFTAFFTTKSRGSGLGLATAKRLVEAHQGVIAVECPPTGGTRVTIRLPLSRELSTLTGKPLRRSIVPDTMATGNFFDLRGKFPTSGGDKRKSGVI